MDERVKKRQCGEGEGKGGGNMSMRKTEIHRKKIEQAKVRKSGATCGRI